MHGVAARVHGVVARAARSRSHGGLRSSVPWRWTAESSSSSARRSVCRPHLVRVGVGVGVRVRVRVRVSPGQADTITDIFLLLPPYYSPTSTRVRHRAAPRELPARNATGRGGSCLVRVRARVSITVTATATVTVTVTVYR